ncbi:hypothetical protein B4U80_13527, partial [Leptotrombidium deliense]
KAYIGLYAISNQGSYVWIDRPVNPLTYPVWKQEAKDLPGGIKGKAPYDAFFLSGQAYYLLKGTTVFKFTHVPDATTDLITVKYETIIPFTLLPKNAKVNAVFEAITSPERNSGSYFIVIYTTGDKQEMLMTKGISKEKVPVTFDWKGKAVTAIGLFDYQITSGKRLGYVSFKNIFKYFELDIKETATLKIVSPAFDNQVLFGCPQTFCFHATIDAISTRDNKIFIIRGNWFWELTNPVSHPNKNNMMHLEKFRTQDATLPTMSATIDCAFNLKNKLYLIRNERLYIQDHKDNVTRWRWLHSAFPTMTENDLYGEFGACFRSPNSENKVFLLKGLYALLTLIESIGDCNCPHLGSQYWYLSQDNSGDFTPIDSRHISYLNGLPDSVEAAFYYAPKKKVYAFSSNFVFVMEASYFSGSKTTSDAKVKLVQDEFFGCNDYPYSVSGEYDNFADFREKLSKFKPPSAQPLPSNLWIYTAIGVTILVLVVIAIASTYCLLRTKPNQSQTHQSQESLEAVQPNMKGSGYSVSEELESMVKSSQKPQQDSEKKSPWKRKRTSKVAEKRKKAK